MRCFYIALAVIAVLLLIILLAILLIRLRMRCAEKKVRSLSKKEKCCTLNEALSPFGFCYLGKDDSISSVMYPWQREMGYCRAYDEAAPAMSMIMDCEPVYFDYCDRRYLIELWKGQYGCTTGAEIGIYVNSEADKRKPPEQLFYQCASDEERLPMCFILYKNGERILERAALHWWLTGFIVGMFSERCELSMEVGIEFPDAAMRTAFYNGLLRAGYSMDEIRIEQNRVYFLFDVPRTRQPSGYPKCCLKWISHRNRVNCRLYCRVTDRFCSTLDRISFIGYCFPLLYRIIVRIGTKCSRKKLCRCRKRMR